jgi:hypothetical protein
VKYATSRRTPRTSKLVPEPIEMSLANAHERRSKFGCTKALFVLEELDVPFPNAIIGYLSSVR